ncbi:MAG: restriction endonuclease [Planctomycetota bacterium]|jgi:hypothetical protein
MDWREYEIYITRHLQRAFPGTSITHNVRVPGVVSQIERQIDILIKQTVAGFEVTIVVDCKYFSTKIDVKEVDSFVGFLADVRASKGILITNTGFTQAAYNRATYDTRDIELRILNFQDLERFQSFLAIPYSGKHGAVVSAPDGWAIDGRTVEGKYLCSMYPAGLSREEAFNTEGFIYVRFSKKDKQWPDLPTLLARQEANIKADYRNPRIEFVETIQREDCPVFLRVTEAEEFAGTLDYTLFLDFPEVVIFLTLLTPTDKAEAYRRKLEWVGEKLKKLRMLYDASAKPIVR